MRIGGSETDEAILAELGTRVQRARLQRNITQADLATEAGVSRPTVQSIEDGRPSQLISVVRILRALGLAAGLDSVVPEATPSPIEMLEMRGGQRQRAGRRRAEEDGTGGGGPR